ncbi:MAG: response regulator [Prevotella sp.]|nr:response regulator [Prevotella sp.]MDD7047317.1 response regulator [Prevotella sp.]MDY5547519.1 response regulator [Prevotella sp.]
MDNYKILIVDDVPTNVTLIAAIIKKLNVEYDTAENGEDALKKIETFKPNIVLLDLMMPDISGWDVIKTIREKYSKEQLAIIVTSAITDHENITECYDMGVNDYVAKPIVPDRLLNTIQIHAMKLV